MEDVLEDRRRTGDWWWVAREFHTPVYRHRKPRSPKSIKEDVLRSTPVQFAISELVSESGQSREDVEKEVREILQQMGHEFTLKAVRFFGVLLSKSWKCIYQSIYVNSEGIETVRKLVPQYPIVLLPTHRSYVDFLVISYAFFHYNLPLPIIAAGQDFMSMKIMGSLMRHAGAFFIRRSFGKDKLYWSVFSEYVKTHVVNGEAPLEFFIEGTRSRSAKSLNPKFGLFTASLEPFFKAEVPDIMLVPVSVSYDRTLEEELYAYELLGVPKPKETTRGLLKARKILGDDYGNFFMSIGKPISVRDFCTGKIDRTVHNLGPRHLSPLLPAEQKVVEQLAYEVVKSQQRNLVVSPFILVAAVLVTYMQRNVMEVPLQLLVDDVRWLLSLLNNMGHTISWDFNRDPTSIVKECCDVHRNVVYITTKNTAQIVEVHSNSGSEVAQRLSNLSEKTLRRAVSHMLLAHYSNQLLHLIVPEGLITLALMSVDEKASVAKEWLYSEFEFLTMILQLEFIFIKEKVLEECEKALSFLKMVEVVRSDVSYNLSIDRQSRICNFLTEMLEPFICGYILTCRVLLNPEPLTLPATIKTVAKRIQEEVESLLSENKQHCNTILSLDTLTNAVNALLAIGALKKEFKDGSMLINPVPEELFSINKRLEPYSNWLPASTSDVLVDLLPETSRAKL